MQKGIFCSSAVLKLPPPQADSVTQVISAASALPMIIEAFGKQFAILK
jgi:hypothetical protein